MNPLERCLLPTGQNRIEISGLYSPRQLEILERVCYTMMRIEPPMLTANLLLDLGAVHSIGAPIHVYPLYENAFRAYRRQSIQENTKESARLYAQFDKVAKQNPLAWSYGKPETTEQTIATLSKKNRMICIPCTGPLFVLHATR